MRCIKSNSSELLPLQYSNIIIFILLIRGITAKEIAMKYFLFELIPLESVA